MRVRVTLTLDIDSDAWATNYGTPRESIREDVRAYVDGLVREQLDAVGVLSPEA